MMNKAERTRNYIIEQTAAIFNKKGYAGTSMNDLTAATGLTKGSIYGNFANKDEVALAAFDYNHQQMVMRISAAMAKQKSITDKLMVYMNMYTDYLQDSKLSGGCPVLNTAVDADDTHPTLREKAIYAVNSWKQAISRLVIEGQHNGEIRNALLPEQVALTIIAMIEGAVMIARLTNSRANWDLIMDSLKNYIENLS
ncbi:TetR/AcrR family transcriptional regulator [Pedobacter sp. AW1-32]|uniref:TetR/AcrR family transcriptional regulator n=1 Tax=Pedobacter sp. AW1-32 TaxID=3383026 RepID=UPI003FF0CA67